MSGLRVKIEKVKVAFRSRVNETGDIKEGLATIAWSVCTKAIEAYKRGGATPNKIAIAELIRDNITNEIRNAPLNDRELEILLDMIEEMLNEVRLVQTIYRDERNGNGALKKVFINKVREYEGARLPDRDVY